MQKQLLLSLSWISPSGFNPIAKSTSPQTLPSGANTQHWWHSQFEFIWSVPPLTKVNDLWMTCPHFCTDKGMWILSTITYVESTLEIHLLMAKMNRRNNYSKLNLCHCGHLTIVISQTWAFVNLFFKMKTRMHCLTMDSLAFVLSKSTSRFFSSPGTGR